MDSKEIDFIVELKEKVAEIRGLVSKYDYESRAITLFFMGLFEEDADEEQEETQVKALFDTNIIQGSELELAQGMIETMYDKLEGDSNTDIGFSDYNINLN
jgi:hypothetical protein